MIFRYKNYILYTFIILTIGILYMALDNKQSPKELKGYINTPQELEAVVREKENWLKILKKNDSNIFYNYLKQRYSDNYNQHAVGHIFGEILFEKEGFNGIGVCDESFFWGCHHGFVSKALVQGGETTINKLFEGCKSLDEDGYQQCIHGIGHGLIGLYGPNGLSKSLNICDDLDGNESCFTGVFMEYNFPTVAVNGIFTSTVRSLDKNVYYPCQEFNEKHALSCYYELPRFWERVLNSDFSKIGNYCNGILNTENKKACFRGVGEIASLVADHDIEKTKNHCQKMPTAYGVNICLTSAALGFNSVPEKKGEVEKLCLLVDKQYKIECPKN